MVVFHLVYDAAGRMMRVQRAAGRRSNRAISPESWYSGVIPDTCRQEKHRRLPNLPRPDDG